MKFALIAIGVVVLLFTIDRLLLAAERRGWIYWRKKSASPGTSASAALEVQSMIEPERAHHAEVLRAETSEEDDEGDDIDSRNRDLEHVDLPKHG